MIFFKKIGGFSFFLVSVFFAQSEHYADEKDSIVIQDYHQALHEKSVRLILKELKDLLIIPLQPGTPIDLEAVYRCAHSWFKEERDCKTIVAIDNQNKNKVRNID